MWVPITFQPGIVRQATPLDTPGRWWDGNLVRWQAGSLVPVGGWSRLTSSPLSSPVRKQYTYLDNSGSERLVLGYDGGIGLYTDTLNDVTPSGFTPLTTPGTGGGYGVADYGEETYGTPRSVSNPLALSNPYHWTIDNFGQDMVAVASSDGRLMWWPPQTSEPYTDATVPATAPLGNRAVVVTAERMVMLLGAGGDPRQVAWSNREEITGSTAWDFVSTTTTAGYLNLEIASPIVTGKRVKEGVLVLSGREAVLMRYVGLPYIYGAENLGKTTFRGPNLITLGGNACYWLGDESFWVYAGGAIQPLSCPFFADITEDMDKDVAPYRAFMSDNGVFPEVWMFYPSKDSPDGENDKYVVYNYAEGWWTRGSLRRTAMHSPGPSRLPYATGVDNHLYRHEDGWTDAGVTRVGTVWAETGVLDAGGNTTGQVKHVLQAMLGSDITAAQAVRATFYARYTNNGQEYTFGPYTPRPDGYTDTRVTGRDIRMRLEATTDDFWSVGMCRLDVRGGGKR